MKVKRILQIVALSLVVIFGFPLLIVYTNDYVIKGFTHWYSYFDLVALWILFAIVIFYLIIEICKKRRKKVGEKDDRRV